MKDNVFGDLFKDAGSQYEINKNIWDNFVRLMVLFLFKIYLSEQENPEKLGKEIIQKFKQAIEAKQAKEWEEFDKIKDKNDIFYKLFGSMVDKDNISGTIQDEMNDVVALLNKIIDEK